MQQISKSEKKYLISVTIYNNYFIINILFCSLGETPLHYAVRIGRKDIIELLLRSGADRSKDAPNIGSPLTLAKKTDADLMTFIRGLNNFPRSFNLFLSKQVNSNFSFLKILLQLEILQIQLLLLLFLSEEILMNMVVLLYILQLLMIVLIKCLTYY